MKKLLYISKTACLAMLSMFIVSCGVIDMELDDEAQAVVEMTLKHDSIYVFVGDSFKVEPVFVPDSVSNQEVYIQLGSEEILEKRNDTIVAIGTGETYVAAISVDKAKTATCYVNVMQPWELNPQDYSNDMVVYAKATVGGKPFAPNTMKIAAFAGSEFRGQGELITVGDNEVLQFRIYSYWDLDDSLAHDPEYIRFKCYDSQDYSFKTLPYYLVFDGETHGSPSEPIVLKD